MNPPGTDTAVSAWQRLYWRLDAEGDQLRHENAGLRAALYGARTALYETRERATNAKITPNQADTMLRGNHDAFPGKPGNAGNSGQPGNPEDWTPGLTDEELLRRAVKSARSQRTRGYLPRWAAVMDAFGLGSSYAHALCERFGLDPAEQVRP